VGEALSVTRGGPARRDAAAGPGSPTLLIGARTASDAATNPHPLLDETTATSCDRSETLATRSQRVNPRADSFRGCNTFVTNVPRGKRARARGCPLPTGRRAARPTLLRR
jgi:hypothetical protein